MNTVATLFVLVTASLISAAYNGLYFFEYGLSMNSMIYAVFFCSIGLLMDFGKITATLIVVDMIKAKQYLSAIGLIILILCLMGLSIFTMSSNFSNAERTAKTTTPEIVELKTDIKAVKENIRALNKIELDMRATKNPINADKTLISINAKKAELKDLQIKLETITPKNIEEITSYSGLIISCVIEFLILLFGIIYSYYRSIEIVPIQYEIPKNLSLDFNGTNTGTIQQTQAIINGTDTKYSQLNDDALLVLLQTVFTSARTEKSIRECFSIGKVRALDLRKKIIELTSPKEETRALSLTNAI